jgi:hypothetical protein
VTVEMTSFFPLLSRSSLQKKALPMSQDVVLAVEQQENSEIAVLRDNVLEHLEKCFQPPVQNVGKKLKFLSSRVAINQSTAWIAIQKEEADTK